MGASDRRGGIEVVAEGTGPVRRLWRPRRSPPQSEEVLPGTGPPDGGGHRRGSPPRSLPPRQTRFVAEYLRDPNGTRAAIRAGYSRRTARIKAAQLLAKPAVQEAVAAGTHRRLRALGLEAEAVLQRLWDIAFGDIRELFDETGRLKNVTELSGETAAMIAAMRVTRSGAVSVRLVNQLRAIELLMKHLGLLKPTTEPEPSCGMTLQEQQRIESMTDEELAELGRLTAALEELLHGGGGEEYLC